VIAKRVSSRYERRLRGYVYWKLRLDPSYPAVLEHLDRNLPLLDLGCGVGVLAFFLREHGFTAPIRGIDIDERKIAAARDVATHYDGVEFVHGSATDPLPPQRNVVILDLLQYVGSMAQQEILRNAAAVVPPGGVAIIRQGIRDDSWRYRCTHFVDTIGRAIRWNRGTRMNFPTREEIVAAFDGFDVHVTPLWGRTPYNNYLFVFTRRAAARPAE
jgi:2-polyprenyl-3-methyl-5-hydroxy-6-metoxy-1,4-benzoquinol methylase